MDWDALVDELVVWASLSKEARKTAGLPTSKAAWAEEHGVSRKWVWEQLKKPEVMDRVAVVSEGRVLPPSPQLPVEGGDDRSNTEVFADVVRGQLIAADAGDKAALDFIRSAQISKPFVAALSTEFKSEFPEKSDAELVALFVDGFEVELVDELRSRGWHVSRTV